MLRAAVIMMLMAAAAGTHAVEIPVVVGLTMTALSAHTDQVDTTSELLDVALPYDPVLTESHMKVGLIASHRKNAWQLWAARGPTVNISSSNKKSESELLRELFARVGPTHTVKVGRSDQEGPYGPRCIGWGHEYPNVSYPNGVCYELPPVTGYCTMLSPALTFDHGVVNLVEQNQSRATAELRVECSLGTTVRLSLSGGDIAKMAIGGGTATLSAEGAELGGPLVLAAGVNTLHMTSEIQGIASGSWSASGVIVIEPA